MADKAHIWYILRTATLIAMAVLLVTGKAGTQDRHPLVGEVPVNQNFTFIHLTDAHIGYFDFDSTGGMKNSVENFADTLQAVKSINPGFVLVTGDNVEYDKRDFFTAFKNLLKSSSIPVKGITPGNHDRRYALFGLSGNNLSDYDKYIKPISNPAAIGNDYSFDFGGYRFIGLDSGADYSYVNASGVTESMITSVSCPPSTCDYTPESNGLSDEQMAELRGELNSTAPKIVFMHHPAMDFNNDSSPEGEIVPSDGGPGGNDGSIAFNRWNFLNYTKDSNVQLVLTGHSHRDAIFNMNGKPVANNSPDRPLFIQTRSATGDSGRGYRIVEVKDGKITPLYSNITPKFARTTAAAQFNSSGWYGLHAYDYQGRHTGMNTDCSDIELGIPDSYYTSDYGGFTSTPQVIVSYSGIKNISISSCMKPPGPEDNARPPQSARADLSITVQTEKSTREIDFNNVSTTALLAAVNMSDLLKH